MRDTQGYQFLVNTAKDGEEDTQVRLEAIHALVAFADQEVMGLLLELSQQPGTVNFKAGVVRAIGALALMLEGGKPDGGKNKNRLGGQDVERLDGLLGDF